MKVSVIIPTYKRANFIKRAIDSVLKQTYRNLELIIVDDNNPGDESRCTMEAIISQYNDERLIYLKHEKNMNGATARNTGIAKATGEYITFLDDDDFFLNDRINKLVEVMENEKEYDCAYTGVVKVKNRNIVDIKYSNLDGNLQKNMLMQKSFFYTGSNLFFRAKALRDIGGFDTTFKRYQDIEVMVRFFRKYKIKYVNDFSVVKDDSSRINLPNAEQIIKIKKYFLDTFKSDIEKYDDKNKIYLEVYTSMINLIPKKDERYVKMIQESKKYGKVKINHFRIFKEKQFFIKKIYKCLKGKIKLNRYVDLTTQKNIIRYLSDYKLA